MIIVNFSWWFTMLVNLLLEIRGMPIYIKTLDDLRYTILSDHGFNLPTTKFFTFEVMSCKDAHIALISGKTEYDPLYEIVIGGWWNLRSAIRMYKQQFLPRVIVFGTFLECNEYKEFWVYWNSTTVVIGQESTMNTNVFLTWSKQSGIRQIEDIGIHTGFGSEGKWIFHSSEDETFRHTTFSSEDETTEHTTFSAEGETTEHTTFSAENETTEHTTFSAEDETTGHTTYSAEDETTGHTTYSAEDETFRHTTFSAEDETAEHTTFSAEDETTEHTTFSAEDETTGHTTYSAEDETFRHTTFSAEDETTEHTTFSAEGETTEHTTFSAEDETTEHTTFSVEGETTEHTTFSAEDETTEHTTFSAEDETTGHTTYSAEDETTGHTTFSAEDETTGHTTLQQTTLSDQMFTNEAVTTEYNQTTSKHCTHICFQYAKWKFLHGHNMTKKQLRIFLKTELDELKQTLLIDKKSVSSSIRAKTCAYNDKDVSKSVGLMGAVIICCPFVLAIISDLTSVYINVCLQIWK